MVELNTQQIGRCGELFVQYTLLRHGVDSAPMTTDPGVDLIAFRNVKQKPVTIQVKTSTHHSKQCDPSGDKWLEWRVSDKCLTEVDYVAVFDFERQKCWLFSNEEFIRWGVRSGEGRRLWWPIPEYEYERAPRKEGQFTEFEIDNVIPKVFGLP